MGRLVFSVMALALAGAVPVGAVSAQAPVAPPPFATQTPPPAPDYARPDSWAARPERPGFAALVPPGATPRARAPRVDVFYVHPTTFRGNDRWNADIADAETNHWTDISVIARQASVFNGCCRVFAPRYRQASAGAFAAPVDGGKAYDLAFTDVKRAFDHYLSHDNHGRPFILAGHSQGALMVRRLLTERVRGTVYQRRLVAAYIIGIGIPVVAPDAPLGDELRGFAPCVTAQDTGCVLSWNSWLAGGDTTAYRARNLDAWRAAHPGQTGQLLCDNPLSWGGAGGDGALPGPAVEGALQRLVPDAVTGNCVDGVVMVDPAAALAMPPLPGGMMHFHDISLYYADIRADAARRAAHFLKVAR